jgi:hypothetical protein
MMTVEDKVVPTPNLWDFIDWKAGCLVDDDEDIQKRDRDQQRINDGAVSITSGFACDK